MRLTNKIREEMRKAILKDTLAKRAEKWKEKTGKQAHKLLLAQMTPAQRRWLESAPDGVDVPFTSTVGLDLGIEFNMPEIGLRHSKYLRTVFIAKIENTRILQKMRYMDALKVPDTNAWQRLKDELKALQSDYEALNEVTTQALYSCTTVNQLKDRYPALVPYLPKEEPAPKLPAVTEETVVHTIKCAKTGGCR